MYSYGANGHLTTFSSYKIKQQYRKKTVSLRRRLLAPKIDIIKQALAGTDHPENLKKELDDLIRLSSQISCPSKPSYTMEEAAYVYDNQDPSCEMYICLNCGFIHYGHSPKYLAELKEKIYSV